MQSMKKEENEHIVKMWTPYHHKIDKNYQFVPKSLAFRFCSAVLYAIAVPILAIVSKIAYGLKIEGKENLKLVEGGKITISNHIHFLDCVFLALAQFPKKVYFPTLKSNIDIPVISTIIRLFHAIPIPEGLDGKKQFIKAINKLLQENNTIHFYPEKSLWPYCNKLRHFTKGPFDIAIKNQIPIIPMVYTYRKPKGFYFWKRKPCITLTILPPVYAKKDRHDGVENLKKEVEEKMQQRMSLENEANL